MSMFAGGAKLPAGSHGPVTAPPPNWTINPLNYEFNMNMVVRVSYLGVGSNNPANVVGAFVGNELRGVATPTMIGGIAYFFITIYSNVYVGETVHFRAYYAPNDAVYPTGETVIFRHNKSVGGTGSPFFINIDPNADYPPQLLHIPADTTLVSIPFAPPLQLTNYLVSLDNDPVIWSALPGPNLSVILVNSVLTVTPVSSAWTGTDSVRIIVRENTVNQLADTIYALFTVLPDYGPPVWQEIPDQTIFPGGVFTSFDLDNYLTFNGPCHQFDFDVFPFVGNDPDPAWPPIVPGAQPMSVIARPLFADEQLAGPGARLAAFVNGVLAGWASPAGTSPNITYSLLLNNVGAGPITFKFYDAANQHLYTKITPLVFAAGGSAGTIAAPYVLQLSPLVPSLAANGTISIAIADPTWLGAYPIDFIVWDCDYPGLRRDTVQAIYTITTDIRPQITSPASVNFQENACSVLYDTQTADPNNSEGAGLTYALAGGADAIKFAINAATGILNWAAGFSPDFENPADANADNHYQVNIQVTNAANLSDTLALTVIITNQAVEPFAATINGGAAVLCSTGNVTLQAAGGVAYLWSTGSTQSSINVNTAGTYTVTVTSTGACTATASMVVAPPPTITASGSNTPVCIGSTIQLSSTPSGGTPPYAAFSWSGPNGYTANVEDPPGFPAIAAAAGIYTVTVTDAAGCTATASKTIAVTGSSAPTITASSNSPVCVGASLLLTSTPAGGSGIYTQYSWTGPNNYGASGQNPAGFPATVAAAGMYQVTVTDNAGCTATGNTIVVVKPQPVIVATSNSPACVGNTLTLSSTPSGGSGTYAAFLWTGPNNFTASVEDPASFPAIALANGVYSVTVTDNAGCTSVGTTTVVVTGLPAITAALLSPVCTGGMVALGSTPSGGSGTYTGFLWSGPNGYTANTEDPPAFPVSPAVAGVYTVTVTDQTGCTASSSVTVTVSPVPAITALNNGPVCAGSNLTLISTPSGGSGTYAAFLWTGPDNYVASSEDPAPFSTTAASAGIYQVKVTDSQGCTATATTTVVIKPKPTLTATSNAPLCTGGSLSLQCTPVGGSGGNTFSWTGPASFVSSLEDPTPFVVTLANAGLYLVTVTDNAGCTANASTSVSIATVASPTITATSNSPVCGGSTLSLLSTPSGGSGVYTAFAWSGPNNYVATQEDPAAFQVYTNAAGIYSVTVTDSKSCKASASVNVVVNGPVTMPTSNSPVCPNGSILLNGGALIAGATYAWSGPNNYTSTQRIPPGFPAIPAAAGVYTLIITSNGCSGLGTVTVAIGDNTPPSITCPGPKTVNANATCGGVVGSHSPAAVSDNCAANPVVTQSPAASTPLSGHNDQKTVTLTANDGNGNTASCTFTVTLKDVTPPAITCPGNTTIAASETCGGVVGAYSAIAVSDNCAANPTVVQSPVATTLLSGHNDVEVVTLTASDGNGNTNTCTFTVTLKDVTPPTITCPANTTIAANATCSGVVGVYAAVTASDNCNANPAVTQSPVASTVLSGHNDVEIVTLTANDGNGNTAACTLTVTLIDVTPPTITCPANTTIAANASCAGAVGAYTPATLGDNCNPNPIVTQSPAANTGLSGHNDVKTVTLLANDGNGNTASCTFTVTLKDVTPPSITCPANATVAADANCSGVVGAYTPVAVSDNCAANPTVTQAPAPSTGLSGHNDVKTLTLTANDGNGNTANCSFTVTLKDITPPSITCPANATIAANASCSGLVGAYTAVSVSDNCNANPTVTQLPAPSTVLSGHNDVEIVTLTANDGNGNTASCTLTVTLKDITPPTITCPANTTVAANATCSSPIGAYTPVAVGDNCTANPAVTQSPVPTTLLTGHNDVKTVTLTANDGNGNTTSCTFTVTLKDITPPTVVCKPFTAALNAAGMTSITTANVFQSGADNCGTVNQVSVLPNAFTCSNLGANTVILTVNDGNGNTATCSAVVTVVDLIPPTMLCKALTVYLNAAGTAAATAAQINNGSFDNCTLTTVSLAPTAFTCANLGANTVTLTGTDQSGNTATCQNTVTVLDTIRPTLVCKPATLNLDNAGQAILTVADVNNNSFDNCAIVSFTLSKTLFTCADLGANTVKLVGTDQSGNVGECITTVTVLDLIPPMAKCKNVIALLGANGTTTVPPAAVNNGSTDNCSFTLSLTPGSFTCANIGVNVVTLKATDGSGNMNTCTATVTVKDVTPPTALCKNATVFLNSSGTTTLMISQIDNGSTDNCSIASRTVNLSQFYCGDIGAPVNVTMTVKDGSGNSATCLALVTVKDITVPTAICLNAQVTLGANGQVTVYGAVLAANSNDNCSVWSYTPVAKTYTAANLGPNNLLITVKDFSGNAATCTSIVTVLNNLQDSVPENLLQMKLSPNPTAGDVQLGFQLPAEQTFVLRIFDLMGHLTVSQKSLGAAGENTVLLRQELFLPGVYIVHLQSEGARAVRQLIVRE